MLKRLEKTDVSSCWNKAGEEEPVFVLLARDPAAAPAIEAWINARVRLKKNKYGDRQLLEAAGAAIAMAGYSAEIEAAKLLACPVCGFQNAEVCKAIGYTYPVKR